jgi:putative addiction module killer protein
VVAYRLPWVVALEIELLLYRKGRSIPFSDWLASLRDARTIGIIRARLNRVRLGNFGDCRSVGNGVEELRINFGPGYRIYYGWQSSLVVVLLCGGDKRTQARDILAAQKYWKEFLDAKGNRQD